MTAAHLAWSLWILLSCGGPAAAGAGPGADALKVSSAQVAVPNPGLALDDGSLGAPGDAIAGNGVPDTWLLRETAGDLRLRPATTPDGPGTEIAYDAGTKGTLASRALPATAGETFILRLKLDTGGVEHPGSVGLAFRGASGMLDYEFHRLRTEGTGWVDLELRATAPEGTTQVMVRQVYTGGKQAGSFKQGPVSLERLTATSRGRDFPVKRILLVTIETFRHDHASLYGYDRDTTPTLARLAAEGVRFDQHHVQAPFTRPSLSSMVTSRYPVSLGITDNVPPLPPDAYTIAEIFADQGYVTSAFLAQFVLSQHYGFNQGFHYFFNYKNDTLSETVGGDFYPWLKRHQSDNAFVWIHLFDPHGPYRPTPDYAGLYRDDARYARDKATVGPGEGRLTGAFVPGYVWDEGETERRHYVSSYDAEIRYVDDQLSQLVGWLEANDMARDTLMLITADHGESMTDHGRWFAHGSLYQHDLHVPMVLWGPSFVPQGRAVEGRTSHLDILPTLLDLAGAEQPPGLKGESLKARLSTDAPPREPFTIAVTGAGQRERVAVLNDSGLKLVVDHQGQPIEAYDLGSDPHERTNVLAKRRGEADKLAAAYRGWISDQLADDGRKQAEERDLSSDEIEALRALGYIE